LDVHTICFYRD